MEANLGETATAEAELNKIKHSDTAAVLEPPAVLLKINNNNHHVVPVGLLIVLCTVYLLVTGLQHSYHCYMAAGVKDVGERVVTVQQHEQQPTAMQQTCMKMDILTISADSGQSALAKPSNKQLNKWRKRSGNAASKEAHLPHKKKSSGLLPAATKKSSAAEPIIYLFALVLLYLLLRAASDINQHYKTQKKGDQRLRRCSLQSYAQAHKQDRRASKESPLRRRPQLFAEARSISFDRFRHGDTGNAAHGEALRGMRKYTSMGGYQAGMATALQKPVTAAPGEPLTTDLSLQSSRRSSVPVSINYQAVQMPQLVRRGSIISSGSLTGLHTERDTLAAGEIKRRVRMINRH